MSKFKRLTLDKMINDILQEHFTTLRIAKCREPEILEKKEYQYKRVIHLKEKLDNCKLEIPSELKETITEMFKAMQKIVNARCPNRAIQYSYVINKLFGILELPEYAEHYHLLKNRAKLCDQDRIWKLICEDMEWKFNPSI